jgi:small subunit ribosomal protein S29
LSAIVGSARKSGHIVLYLNEGDRLRRDGKYIEPNLKRKGIFDLPVLAQEISEQLLYSHKSDLEGMAAKKETMEMLFTQDQLKRLHSEDESKEEFTLVGLLETAIEKKSLSSMCLATVVHTLMDQDHKPFLIVLDDFNGYYDHGHYFHMEYDEMVRNAIPYSQISLFKPALDAVGISLAEKSSPTAVIKRGGIVVGTTESHAVARKFTDALTASALRAEKVGAGDAPMYVIEVPRYSLKETEHVISNMEATGIGRLRFDRGDTVMNKNEMGYLRMVSGSVGQKLLDNCII